MQEGATYTAFWLYKAQPSWRRKIESWIGDSYEAHQDFTSVLGKYGTRSACAVPTQRSDTGTMLT